MNTELRDAAHTAAATFYDEHAAQFLSRDEDHLQRACADMLTLRFGISSREATEVAMTARADMLAQGAEGFIDVDRCTGRMVILRDTRDNCVRMLPVSTLLHIARHPY